MFTFIQKMWSVDPFTLYSSRFSYPPLVPFLPSPPLGFQKTKQCVYDSLEDQTLRLGQSRMSTTASRIVQKTKHCVQKLSRKPNTASRIVQKVNHCVQDRLEDQKMRLGQSKGPNTASRIVQRTKHCVQENDILIPSSQGWGTNPLGYGTDTHIYYIQIRKNVFVSFV